MSDLGTVTGTLRLTSRGAKAVLGVFLGVHLYLVIASSQIMPSLIPPLVAYLAVVVAAVLLTSAAPEPYPLERTAIVVGCVILSTSLVNWNLPSTGPVGYESWPYGANTMLLLVLSLRGRTAIAWAAWTIMLALTVLWCVDVGRSIGDAFSFLSTQAGTLLVGSLFALGLRRTSRRIAELHHEQSLLEAAEASANASADEQLRQSDYLELVARPAIERISQPEQYSPTDREHWLNLEAAIRDSLRAPALMTPAVVEAATGARERGVSVTLLDDSVEQPQTPEDTDVAVAEIIAALRSTRSGDLTARILPAGRPHLATIVIDDGTDTVIRTVQA